MNPQRLSLRNFFTDNKNALWAFVSLSGILIAAVFSSTFHHFDEQYQILEFTSYKLGKTPAENLRWEYVEAMRPWLQPGLYYLICRFWQYWGIESPFFWALNFRLLSGLVSWAALTLLSWQTQNWLARTEAPPSLYYWPIQLQALLWFVPYLSVRTSAETSTTIFLIFALVLMMRESHHESTFSLASLFLVGIFLGFSGALRFPSLVFLAAASLWLIYFRKASLLGLVLLVLGAVLPFVLSAFVDEWGYQYSTVPIWNYVHQNLILGKSHEFGVSPIWAYLYLPSLNFLFFFTFPLTLLVFLAWQRWPKHLITWVGVIYFIVHSFIAHKESRFLFPLAMLLPFYIPAAFFTKERYGSIQTEITNRLFAFLKTKPFKIAIGINLIALVYLCLTPTRKEFNLQKIIYSTHPHSVTLGKFLAPHPFQFAGMEAGFYRPKDVEIINFSSTEEIERFHEAWCLSQPRPDLEASLRFLIRGGSDTPQASFLKKCTMDYQSWPEFYGTLWKWEKRIAFRSYICPASTCIKK